MGALFPFLFDAPAKQNYNNYIKTLNPLLWLKFNEASGNAINYGSEGNVGAVTACAYGQTGKLGLQQAYSFNGTTSGISIPSLSNMFSLGNQRWAFLVNANSMGEGNSGAFFYWQDFGTWLEFAAGDRLTVSIKTSATDVLALTSPIAPTIYGSWVWVFADYDDTNALGLGRRARIFLGRNHTVTKLPLTTDIAGTGTILTKAGPLWIGNRFVFDLTFDGLMDESLAFAGLWTPTTDPTNLTMMQTIVNLTGV